VGAGLIVVALPRKKYVNTALVEVEIIIIAIVGA
jgi:hypothetical protein